MPNDPEEAFLAEHVHEALSRDARVNAPELRVTLERGHVRVDGVVATAERKDAISAVVTEGWPELEVEDRTTVADFEHDGRIEVL
jgi:hypothetical protein